MTQPINLSPKRLYVKVTLNTDSHKSNTYRIQIPPFPPSQTNTQVELDYFFQFQFLIENPSSLFIVTPPIYNPLRNERVLHKFEEARKKGGDR